MNFAGYRIPECNVSFDAIPSLLVEYSPRIFEGWEVVDDSEGTGYWFNSYKQCGMLMGISLRLVIALCEYVKCDLYVWAKDDSLSLHFVPDVAVPKY